MIIKNCVTWNASDHHAGGHQSSARPQAAGTSAWWALFSAFPQKYRIGSYISHISKTLQHECREHKIHRMCATHEGFDHKAMQHCHPKECLRLVTLQENVECPIIKSYLPHTKAMEILPEFRDNPKNVCDFISNNYEAEKKRILWPESKILSTTAQELWDDHHRGLSIENTASAHSWKIRVRKYYRIMPSRCLLRNVIHVIFLDFAALVVFVSI